MEMLSILQKYKFELPRCGDHVMTEFMDQHLRKIHGESRRKVKRTFI